MSSKSVVRIADLPDITSTICCRRTYIARNKIKYPKMLTDMVTVMEKIIRFLRKSAFYTSYAKTKAQRLCFPYIDRNTPLLLTSRISSH